MTFNGSNNYQNNRTQVSVSTRFATYVSDTSSLLISGWNQNLSIRITPASAVNADGTIMYDRNRYAMTGLGMENAKALYLGFKEEILPLIESKTIEKKSVCVTVGGDSKKTLIAIEMEPDGNGDYDMYLSCYTNLDNNNCVAEGNAFRHRFKKARVVKDYDYRTGSASMMPPVHADFSNFIERLGRSVDMMPVNHHLEKYEKATASQYSNTNGNAQGAQNNYQNNNNFNSYSAPVSNSNGFNTSELPFLN